MAVLKWICVFFSLAQLLSLAVGSLNINEKWFGGPHFGYDGAFCLPGICIGGGGGANVHLGTFGGIGGGVHVGLGGDSPYLGGRGYDSYLDGGDDEPYSDGGSGIPYPDGGGDDETHKGFASGCGWSGSESNYCSGGDPGVWGGDGSRETMYCRPVACASDSCSGLHVHLDKGLYRSLVSKNAEKSKDVKHSSATTNHIRETVKPNDNNVKEAAMAPESN